MMLEPWRQNLFVIGVILYMGKRHYDPYPPDRQEKATQTVLEQAEHLAQQWAS